MNAPFNPRAAVAAIETPAPVAVTRLPERDATPRVAQDWEQLVSPGHVLGERIKRAGLVAFIAALPCFAAAGMFAFAFATGRGPDILNALPIPTVSVPGFIDRALTYDPATYTNLGGGQRVDFSLGWMTSIPRSKGLTEDQWRDLNKAVIADLGTARLDTNRWTATPALGVAPKVTRPDRALTEHVARMETGIVTIPGPGQQQRIHIVASVNGLWGWTTLDASGCRTFGPIDIPDCVSGQPSPYVLENLRPASK